MEVKPEIVNYVEQKILPLYSRNDEGHGIEHVTDVMKRSIEIIDDNNLEADKNIAYVVAAYHDLGCYIDRKTHEKISAEIFMEDEEIKRWFTADEIILIKEGIEDHRASGKSEPRSIYGKIATTADKGIIDTDKLIARMNNSFKAKQEYVEADRKEKIAKIYEHLIKKYSEKGYIKIWIEDEKYLSSLKQLRENIKDEEECIKRIDRILNKLEQ